jgi:DNA invertase Pin-like site-specific DNA recombinase
MIYAYLRVSTSQQEVQNQLHGVQNYADARGLTIDEIAEDTASSKIPWPAREIGRLIKDARPGDTILVAEISRLARSTLEVLEIFRTAALQEISIVATKNNLTLDGSLSSKITVTILGLAAEIEREFIRSRTKEALRRKQDAGIKLGRPVGTTRPSKLETHAAKIAAWRAKKISLRSIAKLLDCSPTTLYAFIKEQESQIIKH